MHEGARLSLSVLGVMITYGLAVTIPALANDAVVNEEVAAALTDAKRSAERKQWTGALAALRKAQRNPDRSEYADYKIKEFTAYILTQQQKYGEAASVFTDLAAGGDATREQRLRHGRTAAQLYLRAKQYADAAQAASRALTMRPGDPQLSQMLGQAQYMAGDYQSAAETIEQLVRATEKRGEAPDEGWLQILLNSYYKIENRDGVADAWQALLRHHPKARYWESVLELRTAQSVPKPVELAYHQLAFDLGLLKDADDYEELAFNAIDLGAPDEAVRVLQAGLRNGVLSGANETRFRRMLAYFKERAQKSEAALVELATRVQRAQSGDGSVALGRAYLGQGRYEDAIAAFQRGITQGKIDDPDQARVNLGIAYLKADKIDEARKALAAIGRDSEWRDLAELWSLRATAAES